MAGENPGAKREEGKKIWKEHFFLEIENKLN
jgi:hypothetical protein